MSPRSDAPRLRAPAPGRGGWIALAWLALATAPASAQMPHPMPEQPRALHLRVAEADVVAIGRVAGLGPGRIRIAGAVVLRGEAGPELELKRSPLAPPPLAVGHDAVLLLRGARSPYVLVDEPRELLVLADAADAARWRDALAALLAAGTDRNRLVALYLGWLDGHDATLRESAAVSLLDPRAAFVPLAAEEAVARARVALAPEPDVAVRRTSAQLAATAMAGTAALVAGVPGPSPDAQVVATALRAGTLMRDPGLGEALLRVLESPDAEVRRAGLRSLEIAASEPLAARLRALAEADPDEGVRRSAREVLARTVHR